MEKVAKVDIVIKYKYDDKGEENSERAESVGKAYRCWEGFLGD